jgi:hypothetical protein
VTKRGTGGLRWSAASRWRLLAVLGIAVVMYGALYGLTTWLGALA